VFDLINDDPDFLFIEHVPAEPHEIDDAPNSSTDTVNSEDSDVIYEGTQNVQVYSPGSYKCVLGPPCELDHIGIEVNVRGSSASFWP
jgi:hypothetical protein